MAPSAKKPIGTLVAETEDPASVLSDRELEIARLYAQGHTYMKISENLFIAPATVRSHVAAIYRKIGIRNKTELVRVLRNHDGMDSESSMDSPSGRSPDQETLTVTDRAAANIQAQQRATNDVLRVISHSPGDLDAIFDVILDYALQLSHSQFGVVYLAEGEGFKATAFKGVPAAFEEFLHAGTIHPSPRTGLGRMSGQHRIIHIPDVRGENVYRDGDPLRVATADLGGARSFLAIPMIHRDTLSGAFTIYRQEVKPFSEDELNMLQGFSDQAAIALAITQLIDERAKLEHMVRDLTARLEKRPGRH